MSRLPSYDQALRTILADAPSPTPSVVHRPIALALGDTLGAPVRADRDLPPFNRAAMDGYAIRHEDLAADGPTTLTVTGSIAAGQPAGAPLRPGHCLAIATGAPVPEGADTVVPHERTDRGDPALTIREAVERGFAIHPRAADARRDDVLLPAGTVLQPHHLAIAATVGVVDLPVTLRTPAVTIISSGDEIRSPQTATADLLPHQIRESNVTYLRHAIPAFGGRVLDALHVADEPGPTREAVRHAIATSDIVVTIGGISAGQRDRFPDAFEHAGVRTHVRGCAIQPGKPIFVGSADAPDERPCLVVGLPGNPVSVLATSHLFLWPLVRRFRGQSPRLPWVVRPSARPVTPNPTREVFRPCLLEDRGVLIPEWHGSGDLAHVAPTTGLARLPVESDVVEAGNPISCLPYAWRLESPRPGVVA